MVSRKALEKFQEKLKLDIIQIKETIKILLEGKSKTCKHFGIDKNADVETKKYLFTRMLSRRDNILDVLDVCKNKSLNDTIKVNNTGLGKKGYKLMRIGLKKSTKEIEDSKPKSPIGITLQSKSQGTDGKCIYNYNFILDSETSTRLKREICEYIESIYDPSFLKIKTLSDDGFLNDNDYNNKYQSLHGCIYSEVSSINMIFYEPYNYFMKSINSNKIINCDVQSDYHIPSQFVL